MKTAAWVTSWFCIRGFSDGDKSKHLERLFSFGVKYIELCVLTIGAPGNFKSLACMIKDDGLKAPGSNSIMNTLVSCKGVMQAKEFDVDVESEQ